VQTILYGADKQAEVHLRIAQRPLRGPTKRVRGRRQQPAAPLHRDVSDYVKEEIEKFMSATTCKTCKGARLKPEALAVTVAGENINDVTTMSVEKAERSSRADDDAARGIDRAADPQRSARAARLPHNVGLGYLNLSRSATTLSGGESQRIRLATQIGSSLVGVLYILDEPSIGCISATTTGCWRRSRRCAISATR
jgi:excinuclease UvrABC ATPase subunit